MLCDEPAREMAQSVARRSYGKLVALIAARTRDVAAAEDALSDAFAAALLRWPENGVPQNPEGWLLTVARRRTIDTARRRRRSEEASEHLKLLVDELTSANDNDIPDRRLSLMFACAHPAIESGIRAPLMLQTVLGFDAASIASAFLVSPASMGQRLVRAKAKIRIVGIPFRIPGRGDLAERLDAVLEAIYATYTEGWSDPAGTDVNRRNLAGEGIWLGRLVAALLPDAPEALGLLSLMLHTEARRAARRDPNGAFVPLAQQNTALWDTRLIDAAECLLHRASAMKSVGRFQLEAAIQSAHATRCVTGRTDWLAILGLYDALWRMTGSPVVAVNRALVLAETDGPLAGLEALDVLAADGRLSQYQPFWAARAELLRGVGNRAEADSAFERAIGLESDDAVRQFLQQKRAQLRTG